MKCIFKLFLCAFIIYLFLEPMTFKFSLKQSQCFYFKIVSACYLHVSIHSCACALCALPIVTVCSIFVHIHVAWNYSIVYVCSHLVTWCLLSFSPPFFAPHTCLPSSVMLKAEILLSRKCLITGDIHLWYAKFIINYWCVVRGSDGRGAI